MPSTETIIPTETTDPIERLRASVAELDQLERMATFTLADAIREGCSVTSQEYGWGSGDTACALAAGYVSAKARGWVE